MYLQPADTDKGRFLKLGDPLKAVHERVHATNLDLKQYTEAEFKEKLLSDELAAISEEAAAARRLNRSEVSLLEHLGSDKESVLKEYGKAFDRAWESTKGDGTRTYSQFSNVEEHPFGKALRDAVLALAKTKSVSKSSGRQGGSIK